MIDARDIDPRSVPNREDFGLTDTIPFFRQGAWYAISGERMRANTRPHLLIIAGDYTLRPEDPGLKIDPRGQAVTITLPPIRADLVAGNEYQMLNVTDDELPQSQWGSITFRPQPGEFMTHPTFGKLASLTMTHPGESCRLRAEVVPTGDLGGTYDPDAPTRIRWFITGS